MNEKIIHFKNNKQENNEINWKYYINNHEDLKNSRMNNYYKASIHWLTHGINENRNYNNTSNNTSNNNTSNELRENWYDIRMFLKENHYIHDNSAFVLTTCIRNYNQFLFLKKSIESIRTIYTSKFIYIINDNSNEVYSNSFLEEQFDYIKDKMILNSIEPSAGELNPYLFILDSRCLHDKLIYIHDTVFLKENIDQYINKTNEIIFLWYSLNCVYNDTTNKKENIEIFEQFYFYFSNGKIKLLDYFNLLKIHKILYSVKFGSMSIFSKKFMEKVTLVTNLIEIKQLFKSRIHRCFLERLLSIIYIFIYGNDFPLSNFICGDIHTHPYNFTNTNPCIQYNKPFVKVWQGR